MVALSFLPLTFTSAAAAESEKLSDLAWLQGTWVEERDEKTIIEVTRSKPVGDAMVGTWRVVKEGEMRACEILTMRQTSEGIFHRFDLYRNTDNFDAPRKTVFKLISVDDQRAILDLEEGDGQLTIEITDSGRLRGAWSDPGQPPVVGYDATAVK